MGNHESRSPADRVRERIERWIDMAGLTQEEFAKSFGLTLGWIQKVLSRENDVRLSHLDKIAAAMRTTASELVRSDEERYRLELTPTEVRIMEQLRRQPEMLTGVAIILRIPVPVLLPHEASSDATAHPHDKARRRGQ